MFASKYISIQRFMRFMVSHGAARRASLGPTKVNRLRLIGLGDSIR